jgi:hypothetical protein
MSKQNLWIIAGALLITVVCGTRAAKAAPAAEPKTAGHCKSISLDLTDPAVVALLQNMRDARPVSDVRVEVKGEGRERMRVSAQDFETTPVTPVDNPTPIKVTTTCTSGQCSGSTCAIVGCDPITYNGQTGCSPCSCVPTPGGLICTPNSCTCSKVTVATPVTPPPGTGTGTGSTDEP